MIEGDRDRNLRRFIEIGLIALVVFSPLPAASVVPWALLVLQIGVLVLILAFLLLREKPSIDPRLSKLLKNVKYIFAGFFLFIALQILPLPLFIVRLISPGTVRFKEQFIHQFQNLKFTSISTAPFQTFREGLEILTYVLLGFLILRTMTRRIQLHRIFLVLVSLGFFEAFYGIFELYRTNPRILFFEKTVNKRMLTGTFINQNHLAGYLCALIPVVLGLLIARVDFAALARRNLRDKIIYFSEQGFAAYVIYTVLLFVMALGVLLSRSRAGLFLVAIAFLVTFLLGFMNVGGGDRFHPHLKKVLQIIFLGIIVVFLYSGVEATLQKFSSESITHETRTQYWGNTVEIIRDFPLTGSGLGSYSWVYPAYEEHLIHGNLAHAHNDYLEYFSELGLIGFGLLLAGILYIVVKSFTLWKKRRNPQIKGLVLGGLVSVIVMAVNAIMEFVLHIPANMVLFTVMIALTCAVVHCPWHGPRQKREKK
jgi:O-antigen ligase